MNLWGGMFGQPLGTDPMWQLQQQQMQQALLGVTAGASTANSTYVVSMAPVEPVMAKPKGPETAVEWLDRRVNEVRLPLAA